MPRKNKSKSKKTFTSLGAAQRADAYGGYGDGASIARSLAHIFGSGAYSVEDFGRDLKGLVPKGLFKKLGAVLGQGAGAAVGTLLGDPETGYRVGKKLGASLGKTTARITGMGSYNVKHNSLATVGGQVDEGQQVPSFGNVGRTNRIQRVEYIGDITGEEGSFSMEINETLNPANTVLFPWLSRVAPNYQKYRFHGLCFFFKSMSSDYAADVGLGTVVMATNYNVNDSPFADKATMEQAEYTVSCKPSVSVIHPVECDPSTYNDPLWIRGGADPSSTEDNRLYDMGRFQLALAGVPAAADGATLGELWVTYDLELLEPYISPADTSPGFSLLWAPTNVSEADPFGDQSMAYNPSSDDYGPTILGKRINWVPSDGNSLVIGKQGPAIIIMTTEASLPATPPLAGGRIGDAPVLTPSDIFALPTGTGPTSPAIVLLNGYSVYLDGSTWRYELMCARFFETGVGYTPSIPSPGGSWDTNNFRLGVNLPGEITVGGGAYQSNSIMLFNADSRVATFVSAALSWRRKAPFWRDLPVLPRPADEKFVPEAIRRCNFFESPPPVGESPEPPQTPAARALAPLGRTSTTNVSLDARDFVALGKR